VFGFVRTISDVLQLSFHILKLPEQNKHRIITVVATALQACRKHLCHGRAYIAINFSSAFTRWRLKALTEVNAFAVLAQ